MKNSILVLEIEENTETFLNSLGTNIAIRHYQFERTADIKLARQGNSMFLHRKELIQPVNVGTPDARFGTYLLEQFGGATGELTAALQYWVQSFHVENAGIRDMLQDIAIEEFSHLEMVGKLIAQHTSELDQTSVHDAPLFKLKGGGPHFLDSQGSCWTAAYIQEGGNVVRDLRANISAEAGARQTYESLIKACDDEGTKKTLHHLLTREITHANMFMKALDAMGKLDDPFFQQHSAGRDGQACVQSLARRGRSGSME
jgi:Mn-containing catalase